MGVALKKPSIPSGRRKKQEKDAERGRLVRTPIVLLQKGIWNVQRWRRSGKAEILQVRCVGDPVAWLGRGRISALRLSPSGVMARLSITFPLRRRRRVAQGHSGLPLFRIPYRIDIICWKENDLDCGFVKTPGNAWLPAHTVPSPPLSYQPRSSRPSVERKRRKRALAGGLPL